MAVHKGQEGYVKVGANTVAEIKDWAITETAETIDVTTMGDTARGYTPSLTSASGSMSAFWNESDTTGQGAMTVGAEVTLALHVTDTDYATCSAIITEAGVSSNFDGMVEASFSFQVNGAVTWTTVA